MSGQRHDQGNCEAACARLYNYTSCPAAVVSIPVRTAPCHDVLRRSPATCSRRRFVRSSVRLRHRNGNFFAVRSPECRRVRDVIFYVTRHPVRDYVCPFLMPVVPENVSPAGDRICFVAPPHVADTTNPPGQGCAPTPPARARRIYHNIRCRHRSGRVHCVRGGRQVKPATNHPKNRPDRAGFILTTCMVMQLGESTRISPKITRVSPVFGFLPPRLGLLRSWPTGRPRFLFTEQPGPESPFSFLLQRFQQTGYFLLHLFPHFFLPPLFCFPGLFILKHQRHALFQICQLLAYRL